MARVLVVDDDESMTTLFEEALVDAGFEVETSHSTGEALAQYDTGDFDVVITDIFVPEQGGLEVIKSLKRRNEGVKIIAVSGFDMREGTNILAMAEQAGADLSFRKPLKIQDLIDGVRSLSAE